MCREYFNTSEIRCTKTFPQILNLAAIVDADIATLPNTTASQLQSFWDNITHDDKISQLENTAASFVKASTGLTITSLVLAPLFFAIITLMFMLKRPAYPTVAACLAIFDAVLIVLAAALWITASAQYTSAIESIAGGRIINESRSFWGATTLFPLSLGLYLFLLAALAKLIVVPFMALIVLVLLFILVICAILFIYVVFLLFLCILAMCGGDEKTKVTVETHYYPAHDY